MPIMKRGRKKMNDSEESPNSFNINICITYSKRKTDNQSCNDNMLSISNNNIKHYKTEQKFPPLKNGLPDKSKLAS